MSGYATREYAESLAEFGTPMELPASGGWLLERPIGATGLRDAMGCYPLFACRDWRALGDDIEALGGSLVSVALVADPFGGHDPDLLRRTFPDACIPFKEHFVSDLAVPAEHLGTPHHRRNARRALKLVEVEEVACPSGRVGEWAALYDVLSEHHGITGIRRFSRESFASQLRVPGISMLRASRGGETVGATLWYRHGDVAYYHLGAYREEGYSVGASFALFRRAIELFAARGARWLALGAGAGTAASADDGLSRFKRGWATGTRTAWFCGRVLEPRAYAALSGGAEGYFPAYRRGEFH